MRLTGRRPFSQGYVFLGENCVARSPLQKWIRNIIKMKLTDADIGRRKVPDVSIERYMNRSNPHKRHRLVLNIAP